MRYIPLLNTVVHTEGIRTCLPPINKVATISTKIYKNTIFFKLILYIKYKA